MSKLETNFQHTQLRPLDVFVENGALRSARYDDIFFGADNGLDESRHVFIDGTGLRERLQGRDRLVIAETGFGTGLNLAAVMQLVAALGVKTKIDYISFEACPLPADLIKAAHQPFPEITRASQEIRQNLPPRWPGAHFRSLMAGQVQLHLHYGEAGDLLKKQDFAADIWFLDGFSPAKNADLWTAEIFASIARLSAPDARLATFTVASIVQSGLMDAGFLLEKRQGFGRKRDMLVARLDDKQSATTQTSLPKKIAILGGGVGGAALCAGLRQTGTPHVLIETAPSLAAGASGNPLGLQAPRLHVADTPISRLSICAFSSACLAAEAAGAVISKGMIALDMPEREVARHAKLARQGWPTDLVQGLDAAGISEIAGMDLKSGGLYYPHAQVITPPQLTAYLARDSETITGRSVESIQRNADAGWQISLGPDQFSPSLCIEADHLVLAAGADLPPLLQKLDLPAMSLQVTSGQLSYFPADNHMAGLKMALEYGGYMAADRDGRFVAGASFDRQGGLALTEAAHQHNIALMPQELAELADLNNRTLSGRVSRRLATLDRCPLLGPYGSGISIISALSARGLTLAPLLGEVLARQLSGRPAGLDREIMAIIDPQRFAKRRLRRGIDALD